jgi:hypothetical protein
MNNDYKIELEHKYNAVGVKIKIDRLVEENVVQDIFNFNVLQVGTKAFSEVEGSDQYCYIKSKTNTKLVILVNAENEYANSLEHDFIKVTFQMVYSKDAYNLPATISKQVEEQFYLEKSYATKFTVEPTAAEINEHGFIYYPTTTRTFIYFSSDMWNIAKQQSTRLYLSHSAISYEYGHTDAEKIHPIDSISTYVLKIDDKDILLNYYPDKAIADSTTLVLNDVFSEIRLITFESNFAVKDHIHQDYINRLDYLETKVRQLETILQNHYEIINHISVKHNIHDNDDEDGAIFTYTNK